MRYVTAKTHDLRMFKGILVCRSGGWRRYIAQYLLFVSILGEIHSLIGSIMLALASYRLIGCRNN